MAGWGASSTWGGSLWGDGLGFNEICDFIETRVLAQMDSTSGNRDFRDFMCLMSEPFGDFGDVATDVAEGFNLDTAIGDQLDIIGAVIDLPRSGFNDDDFYRNLLKIQATILMGQTDGDWTGSVNQILTMVRTFIGAGGSIVYTLVPPYAFTLSIPAVLTGPEFSVLFRLLCKAIYASVLGYVEIVEDGDNLWDSHYGAVTDSAVWCSHYGGVSPCGQWAGLVVTSNC